MRKNAKDITYVIAYAKRAASARTENAKMRLVQINVKAGITNATASAKIAVLVPMKNVPKMAVKTSALGTLGTIIFGAISANLIG